MIDEMAGPMTSRLTSPLADARRLQVVRWPVNWLSSVLSLTLPYTGRSKLHREAAAAIVCTYLHIHCHPATPCLCLHVRPLLTARELRTHCGSGPGVRVRLATFIGAPLCCWLWEPLQLDMSLEYNVGLLHDEVEELGGVSVVFIAITAAM